MVPDKTFLGVFVSFSLWPFEFLVIVRDTDRVEVACYPVRSNKYTCALCGGPYIHSN